MRSAITLVSIFGFLVFGQLPAHAAEVTLDATRAGKMHSRIDQGGAVRAWAYTYTVPPAWLEISSMPNSLGNGGTGIAEWSYLIYDFSSLAGAVESARLEVNVSYASASDPKVHVVGLGESMAEELMTVPGGTTFSYFSVLDIPPSAPEFLRAEEHFYAVYDGPDYGQLGVTGPLGGVYSIDFNSDAINAINEAGGLLALGLNWTPNFSGIGYDIFEIDGSPRLILEVDNVAVRAAPVPIPNALLAVLILKLMALGCFSLRKKTVEPRRA